MYYGFRLVALLCLLLSAIYSQPGWAESCGGRVGQMTINVPNIRYLPTLRADTQMTNAMADSGGGIHFVCDLQLPAPAGNVLCTGRATRPARRESLTASMFMPPRSAGWAIRWAFSAAAVLFTILTAAMHPLEVNP
jgi:hypothetical protein